MEHTETIPHTLSVRRNFLRLNTTTINYCVTIVSAWSQVLVIKSGNVLTSNFGSISTPIMQLNWKLHLFIESVRDLVWGIGRIGQIRNNINITLSILDILRIMAIRFKKTSVFIQIYILFLILIQTYQLTKRYFEQYPFLIDIIVCNIMKNLQIYSCAINEQKK